MSLQFGSNLVLANREARLRAPSGEDLSGGNAWAALRAANEKVGQIEKSQILVPRRGFEPLRLSARGPKPRVSTNSTTWANKYRGWESVTLLLKHVAHPGYAGILSLTTSRFSASRLRRDCFPQRGNSRLPDPLLGLEFHPK